MMAKDRRLSVLCGIQTVGIDVYNADGSVDIDVIAFYAERNNIISSDNNLRILIDAFLQVLQDKSG